MNKDIICPTCGTFTKCPTDQINAFERHRAPPWTGSEEDSREGDTDEVAVKTAAAAAAAADRAYAASSVSAEKERLQAQRERKEQVEREQQEFGRRQVIKK